MPVYLYKIVGRIFGRKFEIYCHYHEYNTKEEYQTGMALNSWLHKFEKLYYERYAWISHTNGDRLELFQADYNLATENLHVMPNFPPESWYSRRDKIASNPIRFILVGVVDCSSMYIKEFTEWIVSLKGRAVWDIYSFSIDRLTETYLKNMGGGYVQICPGVSYYSLPEIMRKYDVGVILYSGHIKNYIFNAPNKFFEYYSCGLDVWFSSDLLGMKEYATKNTYPRVIEINFNKMSTYNFDTLVSRVGHNYQQNKFTSDVAFHDLILELTS